MLQYLLNMTAIWLVSLLAFDFFLRRESYHNYNRFYLLLTFLLGILFPLLRLPATGNMLPHQLEQPVAQVITVKSSVIAASSAPAIAWQQWLAAGYFAGVLAALAVLLADIVKLAKLYRKGARRKAGRWTIIETGGAHAPFSFLSLLFVSDASQYSGEEWDIVLAHEGRHTSLLHAADLLLMQAGRIVFWFHPLAYLYNARLMLVHEYQADKVSSGRPAAYGRFLVEQAMLHPAPAISHSFNRSPIKKRIVMLTRRSSAAARTKMLVFIPVALVCTLCFSRNSFSQRFERKGNKVTYRGNVFEMSTPATDTIIIIDPVTGKEQYTMVKKEAAPLKMNGKPVVAEPDKGPEYTGSEGNLRNYLIRNMKDELGKLPDGMYTVSVYNILVDEQGHIAFFEFGDVKRNKSMDEVGHAPKIAPQVAAASPGGPEITVNMNGSTMKLQKNTDPDFYEQVSGMLREELFTKICTLMETAPGFHPAVSDGKNVISYYRTPYFYNHVKVKDHKVYDMNKSGEWTELQ